MADKMLAFAYCRMSSDQQDGSIEQQEHEITRRFGAEYEIVKWFKDEGISASKTDVERPEFEQMLAQCGHVKAILCYSSSRFTRLDSIDANKAAQTLRDNGVQLVAVKEGVFDFNSRIGKMSWFMNSEFHAEYVKELSANTVRGKQDLALDGWWVMGGTPYGYNKRYIDKGTGKERLVKRTAYSNKGKTERCKLIQDETEATIVKQLFTEYLARDVSLRQLAQEMTERGIEPPDVLWSQRLLGLMLRNPVYAGWSTIGMRNAKRNKVINRVKPQSVFVPELAIVDQATFDAVQLKLTTLASKHLRKTNDDNPDSILKGLVICANCGYRMVQNPRKGKRYWVCPRATATNNKQCKQWSVPDEVILPLVMSQLREVIETQVQAFMVQRANQTGEVDNEVSRLRQHRDKLEAKHKRAVRLAIEDTLSADAYAELAKKAKAELDKVAAEISSRETVRDDPAFESFVSWWEEVKGKLAFWGGSAHSQESKRSRYLLAEGVAATFAKDNPTLPPEEVEMVVKAVRGQLTDEEMGRSPEIARQCQDGEERFDMGFPVDLERFREFLKRKLNLTIKVHFKRNPLVPLDKRFTGRTRLWLFDRVELAYDYTHFVGSPMEKPG